MVVILFIPVVVVIVGIAAAVRLLPARARRRRNSTELCTATVSERVTPLPMRRPRRAETASCFRQISAPTNVKVLADYRKARANRSRPTRVAPRPPRGPRPHRPEPA